MLAFYRDTFASQAAQDQPIYDMTKVRAALDQLLECPADQRIAMEGGLQRVASVIIMQEKFALAGPRQAVVGTTTSTASISPRRPHQLRTRLVGQTSAGFEAYAHALSCVRAECSTDCEPSTRPPRWCYRWRYA